jgi:peroxiredoxin
VELESQRRALRDQGLEVAAISYDPPAILKDFAQRRGITYPLLSDRESIIIRSFGLLNPDYPPGDNAHGVPYPGTFVADESGVIREKHFAPAYTERRTAASVRAAVASTFDAPAGHKAPHFTVRTGLSNAEVVPGQRVTLIVDMEMRPGHHAYAPGSHSYRPLALKLEPTPYARFDAPRLPAARHFEFKPLRETVPVFDGRFRLLQDVVLAVRDDIAPLLASPEPTLRLQGRLEYQVCSDTVCFPPGSLPVRFDVRVKPLDRERVPEALRPPAKP